MEKLCKNIWKNIKKTRKNDAILITNPAPGTLHVACVAPGNPKVPKVSRKGANGSPKGASWSQKAAKSEPKADQNAAKNQSWGKAAKRMPKRRHRT